MVLWYGNKKIVANSRISNWLSLSNNPFNKSYHNKKLCPRINRKSRIMKSMTLISLLSMASAQQPMHFNKVISLFVCFHFLFFIFRQDCFWKRIINLLILNHRKFDQLKIPRILYFWRYLTNSINAHHLLKLQSYF